MITTIMLAMKITMPTTITTLLIMKTATQITAVQLLTMSRLQVQKYQVQYQQQVIQLTISSIL